MKRLRLFECVKKPLTISVIFAVLLDLMGLAVIQSLLWWPVKVGAAEVVIDATVAADPNSNNVGGSQNVFISDQVGYTFYRDSTSQCVYSKTTDGGSTWGTAVLVDSQTDCLKIVVWYDRWTPGDTTGTYIHIATMDSSDDDLFYNRLDTSNDTLWLGSSPVSAVSNSGQSPSFSSSVNTHTITKATDGEIYMVSNDVSDSFAVSCSASCNSAANWDEAGSSPFDNRNDQNLLVPLAAGEVMVINRDVSAGTIRSSVWDGVNWSSWYNIDVNASANTSHDVGMSTAIDVDTGDIYLIYAADNDTATADHDIRTAIYTSSAWSSKGDVLTNVAGRGVHNVAASFDQNTGDVYAVYTIEDTIGTANTASVYWKESTDAMTTWGSEQGPLNATAGDLYGPFVNINNYERIYATWFDSDTSDLSGETVANIGPDTLLTATGTHISNVKAGVTATYLGGAFVLQSQSNRTVSTFEVTELGTIDAQNDLDNISLYYDLDTSSPYDCASESYSGSESQFGVTDTNGFSGVNGSSNFTGSLVSITPTQTMCLYVVMDVLGSAGDGDTIALAVTDPSTDVTVSGETVYPATAVGITGSSSVVSPNLTQTHFRWRIDDGSETTATDAANQDESLSALQKETPRRLRLQISNEGSTSTEAAFRLEYGVAAPTCGDITLWTSLDTADDAWNMSPSANITDATDTTNISLGNGGLSDENTTFLSPNAAFKDASSTIATTSIDTDEFIEMEFSIVASSSAVEGETYCFRISNSGAALSTYTNYPEVTISADIRASATGTHATARDIPTTAAYFGGAFVLQSNGGPQTITGLTVTETGTVDAGSGLANVALYYDVDSSNPYDCSSESYAGSEAQFGLTDVDGFSAPNGSSTFSDSVGISDTSSLCVYVVADITEQAQSNETVRFEITAPTTDVVATAASVAPGTPIAPGASTTLLGGELTQTHYHWRNDDGTESAATSATGGSEDTPVNDFLLNSEIRLRIGVSNEGATTSVETRFRLEYGPKITSCEAISVWTDVDETTNDSWDMFDSSFITNGNNTTNIAEAAGGVSDENTSFVVSNGGLRDTESLTASTTLTETQHVDYEYSITSTSETAYDTTYCFRLTANGTPITAYNSYAEITTTKKRDFRVQRGTLTITGTSSTLVAGTDYIAPQTATSAFIRISNSHHTGAGYDVGGGTQNADDVTTYIVNPENIQNQVTIGRVGAFENTRVDWEIVEFIGPENTDNQMVVRDVGTVSFGSGNLIATGTTVATIADDADVVVFITGSRNHNTTRNYYAGQATAHWSSTSSVPVFTRGATGNIQADISYAVVEFIGTNWNTQRVEHAYTAAGTTETESITAINSLSRAFLHTQKRYSATTNVVHYGHTVWLSSIGAVSFELEDGADTTGQVSVAWVIENTQIGSNAMYVQRQNGNTLGGSEPLSLTIEIPEPVEATSNTSLFMSSRADGTNNNHPRAIAGLYLNSTTTYTVWRSDTGATLNYRTEIVEWPVADLALRQNYYRFYTDNGSLTPADPWPPGAVDLGENTTVTAMDDPIGVDEVIRLRVSARIANANLPAGFQRLKLQYGERVSTCSAVNSWFDLGDTASSSLWRGYSSPTTTDGTALSTDPPLPGDLVLSVSDVAGTLVHENPSAVNPYITYDTEDIEYDWYIQHNGANPDTTYCFRMVKNDNSLLEGYFNYPQLRTAGFDPAAQDWRWYQDQENETPTTAYAAENTAPTNIIDNETLALRVTIKERSSVDGQDIKFKLQFSDDITFANPRDVVASSSCQENSLWCYVDGGGVDNTLITTSLLSDGEGCVSSTGNGCGTHNATPQYTAGHLHGASRAQEYSFTIAQAAARVTGVYYFRLVEITTSEVVSLNTGESYPSLSVGSSTLTFSISGIDAGTTVANVVTDATTTATDIDFGLLPFDDDQIAAQRITVDSNATEGYMILKYVDTLFNNAYGSPIPSVSSTNAAPTTWSVGCTASATGCAGYHTTDATLSGGSARFGVDDTYAPFSTTPAEIIYSSIPTSTTEDIVYRVQIGELQPAGQYTTNVVYLAVPVH